MSPPTVLTHRMGSTTLPSARAASPALSGGAAKRPSLLLRAEGKDARSSIPELDAEWNKFQQQLKDNVDTSSARSRAAKVRSVTPSGLGAAQDRLRKEEIALANVWSNEYFYKIGAVALLAFAVALVVSAGPPPVDARCTLPWC